MTSFPSRSRLRVHATLAATASVTALMVTPPAASDMEDREDSVRRQISRAQSHLDQSSAGLVRATRALGAAQARLSAARGALAQTRGQLAAAAALDRRMQQQLEAAVARVRRARAAVRVGQEEVDVQQDQLGQVAVQSYQQGDPALMGLSALLTSQDPAALSGQLNSMQNVVDKESAMLARLEASQVLLEAKEHELRAARKSVARRRQAAAENLSRKEALERRAEAAATRIVDLVAARASARQEAADATRMDRQQLRELEEEQSRIADLLRRRAEAARARAATAAEPPSPQPAEGLLSYPVDSYITSYYGMRLHPVYKRWTLHDGTDFGAACGTPVRAAADGRVIASYYNSAYGNRVILDHGYQQGAGLGTAYNHLTSFTTSVGQQVSRGEVVGYVGSTGYSTGCHLHLMVFRDGVTVDPMDWL